MDPPPSPSADILSTFASFSANGAMDLHHFRRFLIHVQKDADVSQARAAELMGGKATFGEQDFIEYLFNVELNPAIDSRVHHDMTSPMSHYYIFTGHNSYLTGNQLSSASSEKPIAEALRRGVRVVELDLWPNSEGDEVLVYHGRTLTSPVDFKTCLTAIKENAFSYKTDYPVIVTLEDHLPPKLQEKAAEVIVETFGSALYYPESEEGFKVFPSPESLRGKILISTKPPKESIEDPVSEPSTLIPVGEENDDNSAITKKEIKEDNSTWNYNLSSLMNYKKITGIFPAKVRDIRTLNFQSKGPIRVSGAEISKLVNKETVEARETENKLTVGSKQNVGASAVEDELTKPPEIRKGDQVSTKYKRLITIKAGKPKGKSLLDALKTEELVKRVSLSESELTDVSSSNPRTVVEFTHNNFLRIYPHGLRVDSSNYDPILAWAHGAQMVAANMQGYGKHLWIAQGFFKANGGCGYIKKPDFLLPKNDGSYINVYDSENSPSLKLKLKVKICMGYGWREQFSQGSFDRFSAPDFYTRVGIAGIEADTVMEKTSTISNSWVPVWGEEFVFNVRVPEIGVLRLEVLNDNTTLTDDFGGQISLPLTELKHGYRVVTLCDEKGDELQKVKLLLYLTIENPELAQNKITKE